MKTMNIDESKLKRQIQAVERWWENGAIGTLVFPTGFGKTKIGILTIKMLRYSVNKNLKVLILVPSDIGKKHWLKSLREEIENLENILLVTFEECLRSGFNEDVDLLIVDEIHKASSDRRQTLLNNEIIRYKYCLGLTATYPKLDNDFTKFMENNYPILDEVTIREAQNNNWIAKTEEFIIGVEFTPDEKIKYDKLSEFIKETISIFNNDINLLYSATKGKIVDGKFIPPYKFLHYIAESNGWHEKLNKNNIYEREIDRIYNPKYLQERINKYNEVVRDRLVLIGNAKNKIDATIKILKELKDNKIIVFNGYINIADSITEAINKELGYEICKSYHSKLPTIIKDGKKYGKDKQKNIIIDEFINDKINIISSVGALNESLNISKIDVAIITAGTINPAQEIQRRGRATRIDENKDFALIVNIVVKDTIDDKKLRSRLGYRPKYITIDEFLKKLQYYS